MLEDGQMMKKPSEVSVDDNNFLVAIEKLALKCSSNDDLFNHVKTVFDVRLLGRNFNGKMNEISRIKMEI